MSWNNGYAEYQFKKYAEKLKKYYAENGMTEDQINAMLEYDKQNLIYERKQRRYADEVSLYSFEEIENEAEKYADELVCEEDYLSDPFEYGFDDPRLEKIWTSLTDPRDKIIFKALSMGYTQKEIEQEYGIPQSTVCYRKNILRNFAKV